jgi:arylformamidase
MTTPDQAQFRAELDFEITFANGGSLSGEGFRIDVAGPDLDDDELSAALIADLGLLMADEVRISRRRIFPDRHKRAVPASSPAPGVSPTRDASRTVGTSDSPPGAATGRVRYADLSHVMTDGMITVPGLPAPRIEAQSVSARLPPGRYAPGVSFAIGEISMCGNTSTYLDSPRHVLPSGDDLSGLALDRLAGLDGIVVDVTGMTGRAIEPGLLLPYDVAGRAVLLRTGWDARWGSEEYHGGYPFLTAAAVRHLVSAGAVLVGTDGPNVDDTDDPERPAHVILLGASVTICEHLAGLGALPGAGFRFTAVPPKVAEFGTFPVRAFATWDVAS